MFSLEKHRKISFWIIGHLLLHFRLQYLFIFPQINQTHQTIQIQLFDWIQISNFKVDFGFY
jgi:NADH-quinone oxidoreductase subunit L